MKKIDKLILSSFIGPFILTFLVVVFILLTQHMIKYFDDIVGKDLGWDVLGELLFYFAVFMTPIAIPLAVLLSSLITFGNLGEHFELTAIKASGISLLRALLPIFIFVLMLTVLAFYSNNNFVPRAALQAYSLLYDIKQKKPSMDLKEGAFYNGIPDYSIKVEKKYPDGQSIKDVIIYDHSNKLGNKEVTIADSGRMSTFMNDRYLRFELFNGHTYVEGADDVKTGPQRKQEFTKSGFSRSQMVLDLSSFQLKDTDENLFASDRNMRNLSQLNKDLDSLKINIDQNYFNNLELSSIGFTYLFREDPLNVPENLKHVAENDEPVYMNKNVQQNMEDTDAEEVTSETADTEETEDAEDKVAGKVEGSQQEKLEELKEDRQTNKSREIAAGQDKIALTQQKLSDQNAAILKKNNLPAPIKIKPSKEEKITQKAIEKIRSTKADSRDFNVALSNTRQLKSRLEGNLTRTERSIYVRDVYAIQWNKIIANSFACISMFLIGAPLGAIIKRGGLGIPVLVSILFFIIFYVINMTGEKYAKQDMIDPWMGLWAANIILLPIGIFFLRQARIDARLFDSDFYRVVFDKFNRWITRKRKKQSVAAANQ